eukprot:s4749_g3.t1
MAVMTRAVLVLREAHDWCYLSRWHKGPAMQKEAHQAVQMDVENPCLFFASPYGCKLGDACAFCHHDIPEVKHARPRKTTRDTVKADIQGLLQQAVLVLREAHEWCYLSRWHKGPAMQKEAHQAVQTDVENP